jgi:hypothetical protein
MQQSETSASTDFSATPGYIGGSVDTTNSIPPASASAVSQRAGWVVSYEVVAYVALIFIALLLRLIALDASTLSVREAPDALAAWRSITPAVEPYATETATSSPILFQAQRLSFSLLGSTEFAARLLTALVGVAAGLLPLLLRSEFGRTRTLILCAALTLSPVAMIASRTSAGMIWALAFAWLAIWAWMRFAKTHLLSAGITAIVASGLLLFATTPGGLILGIILAISAVIAWVLTAVDNVDETINFDPVAQLRTFFGQIPWLTGLLIAGLLLLAITTSFLMYPAGLSSIGQLLGDFLNGFSQRAPDTVGAMPLLTALYYEPLVWVFAVIGIVLLLNQQAFTFLDRFFVIWTVLGLLTALSYQGGEPANALWLTVPLAALSSVTISRLFLAGGDAFDPLGDGIPGDGYLYYDDHEELPVEKEAFALRWAVPVLAGATLLITAMIAMHLQVIGRGSVAQGDGIDLIRLIALITDQNSASNLRVSVLWTFISLMFLIIGGLLAASLWGNRKALRGVALGILGFMVINGISAGWSATVFDAGLAVEPWHLRAASTDLTMLRDTLIDLDEREALASRELPITVVLNPAAGLTVDGAVAWVVRDFENVSFVNAPAEAQGERVVIATDQGSDIALGGSYVGRPFIGITAWDPSTLRGLDVLAWWFQRIVRQQPTALLPLALYVRMDIYESVPFDEISGAQG